MASTVIRGVGSYTPDRIITNRDLELIVDTSDEWIVSHTGMRERRVAEFDQATSDLGTLAAQRALEDAGLAPEDVDLIICATVTQDMIFPATACIIQANLGVPQAGAYDLVSGCTGFVYGLHMADGMIRAGLCENVLVIAADTLTRITNWKDRATCVLFGDAAGAVVLGPGEEGEGILSTDLVSIGEAGDLLTIPGGGSRCPLDEVALRRNLNCLHMNGTELFKIAVRGVPEISESILAEAGLGIDDVDLVIMHQANQRIIDSVAKRLRLSEDRVASIVESYGNTSAASMPLALDLSYRAGRLRPGDHVLMVGFGAGFTLGGSVIRWTKDQPAPATT
jgi:3-oxoacyl-[acyl-carrier-protein] synthase-3